jgi:hypothetical protein
MSVTSQSACTGKTHRHQSDLAVQGVLDVKGFYRSMMVALTRVHEQRHPLSGLSGLVPCPVHPVRATWEYKVYKV